MADVKWIKISTGIFDDEKILLIEGLPSADTIITIWFKLLILAGKQNNEGVFMLNDKIAYTDEMLATIFRRDISTVRLALATFENFGMIEVLDNVITIPNWDKYQTLDAYDKKKERDREYQRQRREKQKHLIDEKKSSDKSSDISRDCSYSYSNSLSDSKSNNIDNYILLDTLMSEEKGYKNRGYILNHEGFLDAIKTWLDYKKELKDPYKTEIGLQRCLSEMVNQAMARSVNDVIFAINYAISREWKGIYYEKIPYAKKPTTTSYQQNADLLNGILL